MKNIIRTLAIMGTAACFAVVGLVGCSQQEAVEEEPAIEEQPSYDLVIGAESDSVVDLPIKNDTEQSIVGVQFKLMDAPEYSANIMTADQVWEAGQTADIFFEGVAVDEETALPEEESNAAQNEAATADEAAADALLLTEVYDLQLTMVDGSVIVLHQMNLVGLAGMQDMVVKYDATSGLGYLIYQDDGSEVSTLESEQRIAAEQTQAEAEAAAAAEAAEAEAAAEAERQAQASRSFGGGNSRSYDSVSSGSGSGGGAPSQAEDTCINPDDLALN